MKNVKNYTVKDLRRIETEIDNELNYVSGNTTALKSVSHKTKEISITSTTSEIDELGTKFGELVDTKYAIRSIISKFNDEHGINEKTNEIAKLTSKLEYYSDVVVSIGKPMVIRDYSNTNSYGGGVDTASIDNCRTEQRTIKRQIQRLKDSCNGINASHRFGIPDDMYTVFVKFGFIDK